MKADKKHNSNLKFGIINKNETREYNRMICPHCNELLENIENIIFGRSQSMRIDITNPSSSFENIECPICHKEFSICIDMAFYCFKDDEN